MHVEFEFGTERFIINIDYFINQMLQNIEIKMQQSPGKTDNCKLDEITE
jgi:hypothetical protein